MTPKNLWIDNILIGIKCLSDPINGFNDYKWNNLYKYYENFLDYIYTWLYDDVNWINFMDKYAIKFNIGINTVEQLKELHILLDAFFQISNELSDFEVIRRPEWNIMIPVAQECIRLLKKEQEKGDIVLSDEDLN
jgi:hypothetical protein